jgi:hypothetical protein
MGDNNQVTSDQNVDTTLQRMSVRVTFESQDSEDNDDEGEEGSGAS